MSRFRSIADVPANLQGQVVAGLSGHASCAEVGEGAAARRHKPIENREQREQIAVIDWFALAHRGLGVPAADLLCHVPNGGKRDRRAAAILCGMGVRAGWPDLQLMVPRGGFHGLFVEVKADGGTLSADQRRLRPILEAQGYLVVVATGKEEVIRSIEHYCNLPR